MSAGLVPEPKVEHWAWYDQFGSRPVKISRAEGDDTICIKIPSVKGGSAEVWWNKSEVESFIQSLQTIINPVADDKHVTFPDKE